MINLLPPEEKKMLFLKEKERLATVWSLIILVSLICLALILLSIKFYLLSDTDYQKTILEDIRKSQQLISSTDLNLVIKKYNSTLEKVDSFYKKEVYFSQILEDILAIPRSSGLYLTGFSLSRDQSSTIKINLSGYGDTREDLLIFKENIENNSKIKNPYFPATCWVEPKNVNFYLTFEINSADYQSK